MVLGLGDHSHVREPAGGLLHPGVNAEFRWEGQDHGQHEQTANPWSHRYVGNTQG